MAQIPRALRTKDASRAPSNNLKDVKFYARRNQHGFTAGEVTKVVLGMPVEKVRRYMQHGILTCEPASDFRSWGKDVALWLMKHKRKHPDTMVELIAAQDAMSAGKPGLLEAMEDGPPQADEPSTLVGEDEPQSPPTPEQVAHAAQTHAAGGKKKAPKGK